MNKLPLRKNSFQQLFQGELEGDYLQGILYVSHGSRISETTTEAIACINKVKRLVDAPFQEICFLELAEPTISQGMENLIKVGATKVAIVPVLLLSAGHYYQDIPEEVERVKVKYPNITFTYGEPLGVQNRFTTILTERIQEMNIPINQNARILLVGRGSHNPQTKIDIENIGVALQKRMNIRVDACFLAVCEPSFKDAMDYSLKEGHPQIFVVPYLWFTGVLMNFLEEKISELHRGNPEVVLCRQLGNHPNMIDALKERAYESLKDANQF